MNKQITEALEQIRDDVKWNSNEYLVDYVVYYISKLQKEFKDLELAYGLYKDRYETLQSENETLKEIVNKNHETMLDKRYVELNFISKDKIKDIVSRYKRYSANKNTFRWILADLEELLKEN